MKKEKESIRKKIVSFWDDCDAETKKLFFSFMEKNELSRSALYNFTRSKCYGIPLYKLKGILQCIEEFRTIEIET
ncbi:hypothetical protein [Parabacteroides leei]|uniref:hypothetical protein n=1 Tax=Parabacteroides leei TaxID=2939491 RepID=UPI00189B9D20|nr:hypothetical protein [Parabacteroides goldsteinii]